MIQLCMIKHIKIEFLQCVQQFGSSDSMAITDEEPPRNSPFTHRGKEKLESVTGNAEALQMKGMQTHF